jgi:hypothetical protein
MRYLIEKVTERGVCLIMKKQDLPEHQKPGGQSGVTHERKSDSG